LWCDGYWLKIQKLEEEAREIGNDLHEPNLQVLLRPDDIVSVAVDVRFNFNVSTKFKTIVNLGIEFQKLGVL
jgi:hypothetical protein